MDETVPTRAAPDVRSRTIRWDDLDAAGRPYAHAVGTCRVLPAR
jgi:hypothetical protein